MVKKRFLRKTNLAVAAMVLLMIGTSFLLMAGKIPGTGYLGVTVERISSDEKENLGVTFGVLVSKVIQGEAADKAGIQVSDVIQYFNEEKIRRPSDLVEEVRSIKPQTTVTIALVRKGKKMKVKAVMGQYEPETKHFWKGDKDVVFFTHQGAYLGVHLQKLDRDLAKYFAVPENGGALILKVEADTPAEEAGLKSGDVIVKLNEKKVKKPDDVVKFLADFKKGDKIDVVVVRHGKEKSLETELDERPGFDNFRILRGLKGKRFHFDIPSFHVEVPDVHDWEVIWEIQGDQFKKKIKKVHKKLLRKLKIIGESCTI